MHSTWNSGKTIAFLILVALASCAKSVPPVPAPPAAANRPLIVSAAASTKDLIDELAKEFTAATGTEVKVNAGPSNALAAQILAGAPADLFLSANQQWADEIANGGKAAAIGRKQLPLIKGVALVGLPSSSAAHTVGYATKLEKWLDLRSAIIA